MALQGIELRAEALRSLAFGAISSSYALIQSAIARPLRILQVQNLTDVTMTFSFDGVIDHFVLPPNGFLLIDVTANKIDEGGFYISRGTALSVKDQGTPASSGAVYVTALYARGV